MAGFDKYGVKSNRRWWLCLLLFAATMLSYLACQVLPLTYEDFIKPHFHWTDTDYGTIISIFSVFYAVSSLFAGKFVDWMGTRKGYVIAVGVWSGGACLYGLCGWATARLIPGIDSSAALDTVDAGSETALLVGSISVFLFLLCTGILALGQAGNYPAAIKVTAEYFPRKDRAFATSLFNAGVFAGILAAPLVIPFLASACGWEMAFVTIGVLGFVWMILWAFVNDQPEKGVMPQQKGISIWDALNNRRTWSFIAGKFFTDGVWWFFLFWIPSYFRNQFNASATSGMGRELLLIFYTIVTVVSIFGGYLPKLFVNRRGMDPYSGRMLAMLIFAFFPVAALFAQPLGIGMDSPWIPAILMGLAAAGYQAWSVNLYSTVGDMFPKGSIATITGIGAMAGGIGSVIMQKVAGWLLTYSENAGEAFRFLGSNGKSAGYFIVFCFCGVACLIAWAVMKVLVPKLSQTSGAA